MPKNPLIVLKFGSSVLRTEDDLPGVVHEIYRWFRDGYRVIAVVSAFANTTDRLLEQAERYGSEPEPAALAALVATGESAAAALLALALDRAGVRAVAIDPARMGLRTTGRILNANPTGLNVAAIRRVLDSSAVAVVPGFVGRTQEGSTTLLGRGGSDMTALFLSRHLFAQRCRLIKDVAGVYDRDPSQSGSARRYESLTFDDALDLGSRVIQLKALRYARQHHFRFEVAGLVQDGGTVVGAERTLLDPAPRTHPHLRVGLLGLGTVGYGVYRELVNFPVAFTVTGIAVRSLARLEQDIEPSLLTQDPSEVIRGDCDVVIEALGGIEPAAELIEESLRSGKDVITANKLVLATKGGELRQAARSTGAHLLSSAAVGGAVPVLEELERLAQASRIDSLQAVINGTCNFILDELSRGASFEDAVALAQAAGFAEADPTADLDGSDVACKLVLLAEAAFGARVELSDVERKGISDLDPRHVFDLSAAGQAVRLVGTLRRTEAGVEAGVAPKVLESSHPLALVRREHNAIVVRLADSTQIVIRGKGAGRWPTTEAVLGDLFSLLRTRAPKGPMAEAAPRKSA